MDELKRRLEILTDKRGPLHREHGRCWIWTGGKMKSGRGRISVAGKRQLAYRVVWLVNFGEVPDGLHVLHKCDNPSCVRPDHLFLGTHADNMRDMWNKGRGTCGEDQHACKLTEEQVKEIRRRYRRYSHKDGSGALAREYGIGLVEVWRIVKGQRWRHV